MGRKKRAGTGGGDQGNSNKGSSSQQQQQQHAEQAAASEGQQRQQQQEQPTQPAREQQVAQPRGQQQGHGKKQEQQAQKLAQQHVQSAGQPEHQVQGKQQQRVQSAGQAPQPSGQQQQQKVWQQPQQQVPQAQLQGAWGQPQQQVPQAQPQQQGPQGQPQQQRTQGQPQQQRPQGQPQQQRPQGQPQQQRPQGQPQQQRPQGQPQQQRPQGQPQQQRPQGQPQQQRPQGQPQQQRPQGQPQQQGPWGQPQQQGPWGQPQQQRPQGQPQQQVPQAQPQQQGPQGQPQQQRTQGQPQQQRPQGQPQQQRPQGQPQQQRPQGQPQQQTHGASRSPVLGPGVSQAVVNVHEGLSKASLCEGSLPASPKVSLPSALQLSLQQTIPRRRQPGVCGTMGRRITVETNMMSLIFGGNFHTGAVHYDVTITPDKPKYLMRPAMEVLRKKCYPQRFPAYDGKKNLYSATELPFGRELQETITVFNEERQREANFDITLRKVREIDLSSLKSVSKAELAQPGNQEALQVIDIVLRHGPASNFITVGRSFFQAPRENISLSGGLDLWVGTYQSVVLGWKPLLNVDVAHKGFPVSQNVIDLMHELSRSRGYGRDVQQRVSVQDVDYKRDVITDYLKGLKVHYEIPGMLTSKRTVRVNGLARSARAEIFTLDDGKKCTVEQYFAIQKKYNIKNPDYPCLWIGPRDKTIYVPAELCTVVAGQATQKKMTPEQTSNMIRSAATSTQIRKKKILDAFANLNINSSPTAKNEFGLSIQGQFETVPARVLNAPNVHYQDRDMAVQRGVWNAGKFVSAMTLGDEEWTILSLDQRLQQSCLYALEEQLQSGAKNVGMFIGKSARPFKTLRPPTRELREITQYFQEQKKNNLKLVIVVIPDSADAYSKVKQITELNVGLVTQCIKNRTVQRLTPATVGNILLKINSKLNGVNHTLARSTTPRSLARKCMIVGADVTHPAPDSINVPSIAAVASSHDPEAFQYNIAIRLQPPKVEIILDLEKVISLQLQFFKQKRMQFPDSIIVYRDGVSEGQIPQVMHHELTAIKNACKKVIKELIPITFFVVQKRHHIRLFPTDPRNSDDARKNMNVQAGTIVDTHITHPTHIDFYLVSHASIQGTARPTKYKCIWNECNMTEDEIEELTYYLCHLFARCTRSVSYPAPTYYAHLAAFRARALTHNVPIRLDRLEEEQRTKLTLQVDMNVAPMFFV